LISNRQFSKLGKERNFEKEGNRCFCARLSAVDREVEVSIICFTTNILDEEEERERERERQRERERKREKERDRQREGEELDRAMDDNDVERKERPAVQGQLE
jgi:hypothetical protein